MNVQPEIIVDSFAGGGGASEGIERHMRRMAAQGMLVRGAKPIVDVAINHDPAALAMHARNHPHTAHLTADIWTADPMAVTLGRPVGLLWASPDCRHHSRAKGSAPVSASVRGLAWVVVNWAEKVRPRVIMLENVGEFEGWGPLKKLKNGKEIPDPDRVGETFNLWVQQFKDMGYAVEWRVVKACDFGTPTIRARLIVIMRCDGEPIVWPNATHGDPQSDAVKSGTLKPWKTAADILDWDRPCPSILMTKDESRAYKALTGVATKRPLAPNTDARIAMGIKRYVLDAAKPFIVTCNHSGAGFRGQGIDEPFKTVTSSRDAHGLVAPVMTYAQQGGANRSAEKPMHTVTASRKDQNCVAAAYLAQHNTGVVGHDARTPLSTIVGRGTVQQAVAAHMLSLKGSKRNAYGIDEPHHAITAGGLHSAKVSMPLFNAYYGNDKDGARVDAPCRTISTKDRFGLVDCEATAPSMTSEQQISARKVAEFLRRHGVWDGGEFVTVGQYVIVDIGMRMLTPRELARAQGHGDDYDIAPMFNGKPLTETEQRHKIGNMVCPEVSDAHCTANYLPRLVDVGNDNNPLAAFSESDRYEVMV